jgi:DNA polymerase III delta prime subunit
MRNYFDIKTIITIISKLSLLKIHIPILEKLDYFHKINKIPNIIFHGPSGSGKRTIVNDFIQKIYKYDKEKIKTFVMYVNCAHGKGIKFIRDELKFFAKTHIHSNGGDVFKSIILLNADKLTIDAQSALRRCIELFSHNTRFFIIVEDKYKLLKPILSRFCEINIQEPLYKKDTINLYKYNIQETFKTKSIQKKRIEQLKKELMARKEVIATNIHPLSIELYEKGYCGLDFIPLLEEEKSELLSYISPEKRYELLFAISRVRKEFRNEKLFILFILHFLFVSSNESLENISFM